MRWSEREWITSECAGMVLNENRPEQGMGLAFGEAPVIVLAEGLCGKMHSGAVRLN